jgi:hypothetical protein
VTWKFFEIRDGEKKAQVLLDHRFAGEPPMDALPHIGWFGVWCREDPKGAYWSPTEAPILDALEEDLIQLAEKHGNGWAVYLRRYATPGLREYYFYFGDGADLGRVAVALTQKHPGYRIEFERRPDPKWSGYASWLKDAPLG